MRAVIINADDFGLSEGICRAITELLECGAVSNTTVMTAARGSDRISRWRSAALRGRSGVHLQLTGGRPISPPSEIPTLVDSRTGNFRPRESLGAEINPREVKLEWGRQIETAIELLGDLPTHLDSHRGTHRLPQCADAYLELASRYDLPVRSGTAEFVRQMRAVGVRGPSLLIRDWTGRSLGVEELQQALLTTANTTAAEDIIEIVTHPGYSDEYLRAVSAMNDTREDDVRALRTLAGDHWLRRNGFVLVSYPSFAPIAMV